VKAVKILASVADLSQCLQDVYTGYWSQHVI